MELNVFFEDPFWIGLFYLRNDKNVYVERVVFGSEPQDGEIYNYVLYNYQKMSFKAVYHDDITVKPKNPKRMLRIIKKQNQNLRVGTKSMQALKKQHELNKQENKRSQKELKRIKDDYLYQLKKQKRKARKRGH